MQKLYADGQKKNNMGIILMKEIINNVDVPVATRALAAKIKGKELGVFLTLLLESNKEIPLSVISEAGQALHFAIFHLPKDLDAHINFASIVLGFSERYGSKRRKLF